MSASPKLVRFAQSTLAMLLVLALPAVLAEAAVAGVPLNGGPAPLTGSAFQGADGNQKTPLPGDPDYVALPARTDWQTYASSPRLSTLPDASGLQDTWFAHGKEQEPDKWTFQQDTVSPGKTDVLGAWSLSDPVSSNVFLYLAFFRPAAGGTTFYNFELNQLTSTWTNSQGALIPCRKNGDVIVSFELQGNAGNVGVRVWKWQASEPGPAACPEGKIGEWTPTNALSTDPMGNTIAQGAMNAGPITNYLDFDLDGDGDPSTNPSPASFDTADTFGEAALNLSKILAGFSGGDSCFNFGQLQLHTRSSEPFTADLKDFIAPQPIVARSCAIEGTKYHDVDADGTQDAGEPGLSGFRIYADTNDSGSFDAGEPSTFTADGTQPGKPLGSWVLGNLRAGSYKIREDLTNTSGNPRASEGWTCSDPVTCRFDVSLADGGVVGGLKFGNYQKARVRVEKQTVPDGAADSFGFTSTLPGKASFNLSDGGVEETLVKPGVYTATETPHPDFDLTDIACTAGGQVTSPASVQFDATSGQTITCTYTNTRKTGQLTVRKVLDPANDPGKFDLKIGSDVVVDDGGHLSQGTRTLATDTGYTVSEAEGTGTSLSKYDSSVVCKDGDVTVASGSGTSLAGVPVVQGRNVVCTFTNARRKGSITVVKQLVPSSDAGAFDLKVGGDVVKAGAGDGDSGTKSVAPGTYSVSETGAEGTSLQDYDSAVACEKNGQAYKAGAGTSIGALEVDSDDAVVCTITNTRLGTVKVEKQTDPATDDSFHFSSNLPGGGFDLSDRGVETVTRVLPGTYEVTEDDPTPGYDLTALSCDDGQSQTPSTTSKGERTATIEVDPGETVRCVFTNTRRGNVIVVKTEGHGDPAEGHVWRFTLTGGPDEVDEQRQTDGGSGPDQVAFASLKAGTYTLCEVDLPAGWHSSLEQEPGAVVDPETGDVCVAITIANGETETIEVDNVRPDVELEKTVRRTPDGSFAKQAQAHVGDTVEYRFRVTNPGVGELSVVLQELAPDRCDEGTPIEPAGDADDDGKLDPGEQWDFFCTHEITADDPDPLPNTAKVTGTDEYGNADDDESSAEVDVLHPDIEIDKQVDRQSAHVGDTLGYRFVVTNAGDTPLAVEFADPRCDAGTLSGPTGDADGDDRLDVSETWVYTCSHVVADQDPSPLPNTATVTGTDELGGEDEDADSTSVVILKPGALVVKEGNQFAYAGDTVTFTFAVTNTGNAPLSDVTVTDDRCAPVTRTSGDELLDPGETWMFACSKQIPAGHRIGDENPIRNVVTATGKDQLGKTVESTDDHLVRVLHPAIDIEKSGPATALVGTALGYTLTVTNPGDVPFASQQVVVADPRCEAPPAGPSTGGDATPGQLDPGDTWTYTCVAQTTGQPAGTFVNTATVTGKDFNGRTVSDKDDFPTMLQAQEVLPGPVIISGRARLHGPSGCVRGPFTATVRGRRIARVTFFRDGKRIKTIAAKPGQRKFTVRVAPGARSGIHRVTARIRFRAASRTRTRTLRLSYQRCRRQVVQPRFTG
jgi:hypothetical protein